MQKIALLFLLLLALSYGNELNHKKPISDVLYGGSIAFTVIVGFGFGTMIVGNIRDGLIYLATDVILISFSSILTTLSARESGSKFNSMFGFGVFFGILVAISRGFQIYSTVTYPQKHGTLVKYNKENQQKYMASRIQYITSRVPHFDLVSKNNEFGTVSGAVISISKNL